MLDSDKIDYSQFYTYLSETQFKCNQCEKVSTKSSIISHIWRVHGKGATHDPNDGFKKGIRTAYNKGLTKENSDGVKKHSEIMKGRPSPHRGLKHSDETKRKISERQSLNNKGGRCKWYKVDTQSVQGSWERDLAIKMNELLIPWKKLGKGFKSFVYIKDTINSRYTPDFSILDTSYFIEVKGVWWGDDINKMKHVYEQHSNLKNFLFVVEEKKYLLLLKATSKEDFMVILLNRSLEETKLF